MIFLVFPAIALACLACSVIASTRTPRHEASHSELVRHAISSELALWAIALLLLWIGLR